MREVYRVIDANLNRAREGLRVLEELARLILNESDLTSRLKELRHHLNVLANELPGGVHRLLESRDAVQDVGAHSWSPGEQKRDGLTAVALANFKRVQEAARVMEEFSKLFGPAAAEFKKLRFTAYVLEQEMLGKIKEYDQS